MHSKRDPRPKVIPSSAANSGYRIRSMEYLPLPYPFPHIDYFTVLQRRRSSRQMGPLQPEDLSKLLWCAAKTLSTEDADGTWEHRIPPSAGGCHPIDIFLIGKKRFRWYDPIGHALADVVTVNLRGVEELFLTIDNVLSVGCGSVIWQVAQVGKTLAKYDDGETLVWRDAGVVLATICYTAEALGLAACPLGITGEPWISELLGETESPVVGIGGCLIGSRI